MEMKLREWIEKFNNGDFESKDYHTQCNAGWYDWFCRETSLANKTKRMGAIIKKINGKGKVYLDTMYVWFKNNCPLDGPLYDDFRFADIETGDTLFTTQIDCCWNKMKYTVYGKENDFKTPLFATDSSRELSRWFNES
jgi:hypothetical protein